MLLRVCYYDILRDPWILHEHFIFPLISQGDKNRSFKLHWINEYPYLIAKNLKEFFVEYAFYLVPMREVVVV